MAATEAPAPHESAGVGCKSPSKPAAEASTWRRIDDGPDPFPHSSSVSFISYSTNGGNEALASSNGRRRRRCYGVKERAQVAETRKRGACDECRDRRVKCHHASQRSPTDQYCMESHEQFALGLTNPSPEENEHGHKKVMEKTIAALDHKLVGVQNESSGQELQGSANSNKTDPAPVLPSSRPLAGRRRSSQQRRTPAQIHRARKSAAPSKALTPGINKPFRVLQASSAKQRSPKKQKTIISSLQSRSATEMPAEQNLPALTGNSSLLDGRYSHNVETSRLDLEMSSDGIPVKYPALVAKSNSDLKAEKAGLLEVMPWCHWGTSYTSEQESVTAGHEDSVCSVWSPVRTPSPRRSEDPTSSSPAFVHMSDLSLERLSTLPQTPGQLPFQEAPGHIERGRTQMDSPHHFAETQSENQLESFTDLLNNWDGETCVNGSADTDLNYITISPTAEKYFSENGLKFDSINPKLLTLSGQDTA